MSLNYARIYALGSILLALTVIAAPFLVWLTGVPNALFREIFMTIFPLWLVFSLVSVPVFRGQQLPILSPASFVALVCIIFAFSVFVGELSPTRQIKEFWIPVFIWLFMFYYGTVSWLLFLEAGAPGKKAASS